MTTHVQHSQPTRLSLLPLRALLLLALAGIVSPRVASAQGATAELHVATSPPGAVCTLNGSLRGNTPITLGSLAPGEHLVSVTLEGYREARRSITLGPGARSTLEFALEPLRGLVLVRSTPAGATLSVNGAERGRTPLTLTDLPVGTHRLRLQATDCLPLEQDLVVDSRLPQRVDIVLRPSTATLQVTSDPPGAVVRLDQADQGTTPTLVERLQAGPHELELLLAGYTPHQQPLAVEAGESRALNVVLTPIPARLSVTTPDGSARVYLNNEYRGETPLTLDALPPADYRLRVERTGYATDSRTISLGLADTRTEEVRLELNSGTLELITEPAGVTVFVDGVDAGITRYDTNSSDRVSSPMQVPLLTQGPHTLVLSLKGYFSQTVPIEIRTAETLALHRKLPRRFIPDYEIETATGIDRGLLLERDKAGNLRLEVRPGVIKTIRRQDVTRGRPLTTDEMETIEAQQPRPASGTDASPAPAPTP